MTGIKSFMLGHPRMLFTLQFIFAGLTLAQGGAYIALMIFQEGLNVIFRLLALGVLLGTCGLTGALSLVIRCNSDELFVDGKRPFIRRVIFVMNLIGFPFTAVSIFRFAMILIMSIHL